MAADAKTKWDAAIQEAYASNPSHEVIVHTLELIHPKILGEDQEVQPIRIARTHETFWGVLEEDAPYDAGEWVEFIPLAFNFELPTIRESELPKLKVSMDNVGKLMMDPLKQAAASYEPIEVYYRPYLLSTPEKVQMDPPLNLRMHAIRVDAGTVEGLATFDDIMNRVFPGEMYLKDRFPLLFTQD